MQIVIDPTTYTITVPLTFLTPVPFTPNLYDCDTIALRQDLREWESSEQGRTHPITHVHYPSYTIAGTTYASAYRLTQLYAIQFEDGNYSVRLQGTNNNLFDIADGRLIKNNVLVIPGNSAGLQIITTGSGLSAEQIATLTLIADYSATIDGKVDGISTSALTSSDVATAILGAESYP